ncbi:hypothetical protein [Streptomyces sp. ISL-11]|uniref:hypothetical protein n=1 Tax=Streptomyces sp. ISL-11 TaxID=2819174 RepID=UPI001BE6A261|nr:hypothetical protein [Streptomyces sp. ISL-11]MBT2384022.1 hypothetical protein [Streptomyces sp. ISL-11]
MSPCSVSAQWLARAAFEPAVATALWAQGQPAPLMVGRRWDLVRLDFRLATAVITQLKTRGDHIGPYVMGGVERAMWWLLPLGSARRLVGVPDVIPYRRGAELFAPPPGGYAGDRMWVLPDGEDGRRHVLTSADDLREALRAAPRRLADRATPCR